MSSADIVRSKKDNPYLCETVGSKIDTVQEIDNGIRLNYKMGQVGCEEDRRRNLTLAY